jgi:ABC-type nitrate/sulfonate/bicarbonate transport system permease component
MTEQKPPASPLPGRKRNLRGSRAPGRRGRLDLLTVGGALAGFGLVALVWWIASIQLGPARLPAPWEVAKAFFPLLTDSIALSAVDGTTGGIAGPLAYTTSRVLIGVALGTAIGVPLGILMGSSRGFDELLTKVVEIVRTIPPLAAIPFFLLWFGISETGQTILVAFYTGIMILITTRAAVRYTDPVYSAYARTLGAGRLTRLRTVLVPAITPRIVGGIRVALALAWGLQVVAELLGSQSGIGRVFVVYQNMQAVTEILVSVIWLSVIGYAVDKLYLAVTSRVTQWVPRAA